MKIVIYLLSAVFLFAQTFILPEISDTNVTEEINLSQDVNFSENNTTQNLVTTEEFNDTYVSINAKSKIALIIDKKRFFKLIPPLINSLNAYYAQKGIDYEIELFDKDVNLSSVPYKHIFVFTTDKEDLKKLNDSNTTYYLPLLSYSDTNLSSNNIYYGGLDFKKQIEKLSMLIDGKTDIITSNTYLANKLLSIEKNIPFIQNIYTYPKINIYHLSNKFVFFNTKSSTTAQILSKLTQNSINTKLLLAPQLCYDPLIIRLTQPLDVRKMIIANSIINPPEIINEYSSLLNSDIKYNWLNYATDILANKAYNLQNGEDEFYMSDFNIYIFLNQINYKTKLYRIINGAFKAVE